MKKIIISLLYISTPFLLMAQPVVKKIDLKGTVYTVTTECPKDLKGIFGEYTYEWGKDGKEPIIELIDGGSGYFQPHMVSKIPITFWFDCDEKGIIRKQSGINGRFQITLLIQYGESTSRNYPANSYDLMGVMVVPDENYAVIYGERYKKFPGN